MFIWVNESLCSVSVIIYWMLHMHRLNKSLIIITITIIYNQALGRQL